MDLDDGDPLERSRPATWPRDEARARQAEARLRRLAWMLDAVRAEGVPRWSDAMETRLDDFKNLLARISPDFQTKFGYERDAPGSADLRKCTDYIAETFGCLAMTLEMPFKDAANMPMPEIGWSPGRSMRLGAANVDAMWRILDEL